ncbi:MAG: hydrogenase 4 subunit F [Nitrospirae bacterium]|nr:hydrogenase 4 subunit F [Nitrospirota bacterium]
MSVALLILIFTPLMAGLLSLVMRNQRALERLQCLLAVVLWGAMTLVVSRVASGSYFSTGFLLRVDPLSAFMDLMLAFVGGTGLLYAVGYMGEKLIRGEMTLKHYGRFFFFFNFFLFAMLLTVNLDNIALMWISLESSTLAAALLVGFERTKSALEAGWKYVILSFIGIALSLFGTVLMYYASERVLGIGMEALSLEALYRVASLLNPAALKLAFIFALIGYGTKAGVVPMHTWLPDAHAEAPTPVSAILSGLMLNVGLYALLRFKSITDQALGESFAGPLVLGFGFLSLTVAAFFMLIQKDYKRLLAYSSIEHVGIAMIGFGVGGPLGVFGGFFHMIHHALVKSTAFYAAGGVLLRSGHKGIERVTGMLKRFPIAGIGLFLAAIGLAGMPPAGLFVSELLIATSSYRGNPVLTYLFLSLLILTFGALMYHIPRMVLGNTTEKDMPMSDRTRYFMTAAILINLAAMVYGGFYLPRFLQALTVPMTGIFGARIEFR